MIGTTESEQVKELLLFEYSLLQGTIDKFDGQRVQLKGCTMAIVAGLSAVAISTSSTEIFAVAALFVPCVAIAEFSLIDIQDDAIKKSSQIEEILNDFMRGISPQLLVSYEFGLSHVFGGARLIGPRKMWEWARYRTFNPYLYLALFLALCTASFIGAPAPAP